MEIIRYSTKVISGQISVREDFKEEVRWLLKHDVAFMSGKERSLSREKCHEPRPAGGAGPHENNVAMRRDCPKAQMPAGMYLEGWKGQCSINISWIKLLASR